MGAKLKGEYPIEHHRERGDQSDDPFVVRLPSIKRMKEENSVLYAPTIKKSSVFVQELSHILHDDEKDNDLAYLIANETNDESEKVKTPSKNRLENYFMVATRPKLNEENIKKNESESNVNEMKVEEEDKNNNHNQKEEEIVEPKKKKRRIVMCELIEDE